MFEKLRNKVQRAIARPTYEAWKKQAYDRQHDFPESMTKPYIEWMEKESLAIFEEGGMDAVELARRIWFADFRLKANIEGVMIGGEGEVEQVTYKDLKFTDVVYRVEDGKVWQYMYVGKNQFFRRDYLLIDASEDDTFYRSVV